MKNLIRFSILSCLIFGAAPSAFSASYCEAWSKYLQEVPPGLLTKDAPIALKGDQKISRYHGNFAHTKTRDIECDTSNGCNFKGEEVSLTGAMKVSNELITTMPKEFGKVLKKFTDQVNAYQAYTEKKKASALIDAKQKGLLQAIAATSAKGRAIVVKQGLAKDCFNAYERALNAKLNHQTSELRKITAANTPKEEAETSVRTPANTETEAAPEPLEVPPREATAPGTTAAPATTK